MHILIMELCMVLGLVLHVLVLSACEERVLQEGIENIHDPDIYRNVTTLISSKGYPVEDHTVQTADGFILSMQRIPHGRKGPSGKGQNRPVVFLQHGLLASSSVWVLNFPEQSLGFILAEVGFDVWMGNTRGNTYSRHHVKYTPDMAEFWNYSFDQMAKYDLPAMIDYVLNATGQPQLQYIGHSQGTTAAFALLSESPEYNEKIKLFVALAPVTSVGYITGPLTYLAPFADDIEFLTDLIGVNEFLPSTALMKFLSEYVCESRERFICEDVAFLLLGIDKYQINTTRLGVYAAHYPAGTSSKSIVHYGQMVNSKKFVKFDYGTDNMDHYNQTTPPEYDVSRITTPVAIFWSVNDNLADPVDVDILLGKLKSVVTRYLVPYPPFTHTDFVVSIHGRKLLYNAVLKLLNRY